MFPPTIPHFFIKWLTAPGDVVYDPFCGRGTTVLEACSLGRIGLGSDANPLAWVLTSAKAEPPSPSAVGRRLSQLRAINGRLDPVRESEAIQEVFDPEVLAQLLWLRTTLSRRSLVDRHLLAVLLGILHANANTDGTPRGLTIAMPNTFAMAPGYVMRFKKRHRLVPRKANVLDVLESRLQHLGTAPTGFCRGAAWLQDASKTPRLPRNHAKPRLIFSSPPYLGVMKYGKLNWLRLWLLGHSPREVDSSLFASSSLDAYLGFMATVINQFRRVLADDGFMCLVVGDVRRREVDVNLAAAVAEACLRGTGLRVAGMIEDKLPTGHKVSRIWKERHGRATKTDRILILAGPKARRLPQVPKINWALAGSTEV
jgi:site-specific DNA-methyltransferase (adenine-specific)